MRSSELPEEHRQAMGHDRFHHPDPTVQRRMEILWFELHGETHERIAALTDTSRRTVQRVLDLFWNGGLDAQCDDFTGVNTPAP